MGMRQFPRTPLPVLGAHRQDFRRERPVDLEQLEFDRVAPGVRSRINKGKRSGEIAAVIARSLGNEFGAHRVLPCYA